MTHVLSRQPAAVLEDGRGIEAVTLSSPEGVRARILTLGATLQSLHAPDRSGRSSDLVLGFSSPLDYLVNRPNFGVTVGRYANRIAGARFTLDGRVHELTANDGPHALHGGQKGLGRALWTLVAATSGASAAARLSYLSPAGEDGFPGELMVEVTYELRDRELSIRHRARCSAPTVVNLTNHSYFNLAGTEAWGNVYAHTLMLPAEEFLPVDASLIPTGELRAVGGTAFDFRVEKPIGRHIRCGSERQILLGRGYDHSWVIDRTPVAVPRLVARLSHEPSGRVLEVLSTQPAVQVYTGNFLDGSLMGKDGLAYRQGDGVAFEPQMFPDTPNRPEFGSARLDPGTLYSHDMLLRLSVRAA
jgi:aldose 1-epimerase